MQDENQSFPLTEQMFLDAGWEMSKDAGLIYFYRQISIPHEDGASDDDLGPMILCFGNNGYNQDTFFVALGEGNLLHTNCVSPAEMNEWSERITNYTPNW